MVIVVMVMMVMVVMVTVRICEDEEEEDDDDYYDDDEEEEEEPLFMDMCRKHAAPKNEPRTQTCTLCEPAQSKCTSTYFNISQEPLYSDIYRKKAAPQSRGPHLVRACAVETHVKSSGTLYGNLQERCHAPKPRRGPCASLHRRN